MVRHPSEKVEKLANFLKFKKDQGERVGLFLGHRAGVLYNDKLYEVLKSHITIDTKLLNLLKPDSPGGRGLSTLEDLQFYASLSAPNRFKKCYEFLGKHFKENSIHNIFSEVLTPTQNREEDKLMAELINAEFFDTIFTTNFDTSLEDNCDSLGMIQDNDYELLIYEAKDNIALKKSDSRCGQIIKLFGDFSALNYKTVGNEFDLETDPSLKDFLVAELAKDIVVLGYDPIWDKPIELAFQETEGTLWFVNEKRPPKNSHFDRILREPSSKCIVGPRGNYGPFLHTLYGFIGEKARWTPKSKMSLPTAHTQDPIKKKAFISYSHRDEESLKRLQIHLKGFLHVKDVDILCDNIWDDTKIPISANWQVEIENALAQAKVAVLLVSADFFASDFIREKELPMLYKAAQSGQVQLISVIIGPSVFKDVNLSKYQTINRPTKPLMNLANNEQEAIWAELAKRIVTILST